ncbi:MAG: A/G-specific adenine glycosylase [Chloroflexi bacterium]|nr:A/G-specific adenine glycosylase [Chloroflexota bacterium]
MPVPAAARSAILSWFDGRGRDLPFRRTRDPWAILVSEAMAQQTQIARVAEAWVGVMASFPTVAALAVASPADVLRAWRGLGYNRRATNLRRAAIAIVAQHGGEVPREVAVLERLPGVGPYTARAVAALAFGTPVGPVDTNVRRVLRRILADEPGVETVHGLQAAADAAAALGGRPGVWTHAVMDIGATLCRPRAPRCDDCPAQRWCAFAAGLGSTAPCGSRTPARAGEGRGERPFATTSRWLRGRILDALRDAPAGDWAAIEARIGEHDAGAVEAALDALGTEGLAERHPSEVFLARLPLA